MRILEENNYILECWKCDTKIIYTYKDCSFDSRYSSYELCCPNCHNRYSSTRNELFGKQYKENEYNSDEKEIERLNKGIKELDNMFYETFRISQNGYYSISKWELKEFTDKIKELKGSDSNE